mgnify:CR=1 FL=1
MTRSPLFGAAGLLVTAAHAPLGIQVLRQAPTSSNRAVLGWSLTVIALLAALYFLGQAG